MVFPKGIYVYPFVVPFVADYVMKWNVSKFQLTFFAGIIDVVIERCIMISDH